MIHGVLILSLLATIPASASSVRATSAADCDQMTTWDYVMGMCMPRAMADMPMKMLMVNVNGFAAQVHTARPRGTNAFAAPHFAMLDAGRTLGDRHYVNVDLMTTFERWTFPKDGYPELLQIGEHGVNGTPFVDAQHPHSSPVMGLTLSDTISYGRGQDHFKIWFAPRGQATEGPIAFMHRPTGLVNPDAPLGHHVGQDVAHITSTVLGTAVRRGATTLQASAFHGAEPEPTRVDLPVGRLDSAAARAIYEWGPRRAAMASVAYAKSPEPHEPELDHVWRYSASVYAEHALPRGATLRHALIYGLVNFYDHAAALNSFTDEVWWDRGPVAIFGRFEALERTPRELAVGAPSPDRGRFVFALTLGLARDLWQSEGWAWSVGGSVTQDLLPAAYRAAYGEGPFGAKIFARVTGMHMRHF